MSRVNSTPKIKAKESKKSEIELFFVSLTLENFLNQVTEKVLRQNYFIRSQYPKAYHNRTFCTITSVGLFMTVGNRAKMQQRIHICKYSYLINLIKLICLKSNLPATAGQFSKPGSREYFNNM